MYAVLLFLTLTLGLTKGATLPDGSLANEVTFDYDCSQVECTTDSDICPPDSIERQPAPAFDVLYGPEDLMPSHDFYDDVDELGDAVEQHFDELPMELSEFTALPVTANSTISQLTSERDTKDLETEKGPELVLVKRQLQFDHGPSEDMDAHERMLQMCCPTITLESLRRRRRRRYTSVEDCKCKACQPLPQCPSGEVAVRVHEAKGVPGDCCATYACAPKRECGDAEAQPYWRDACTRCSCHGEYGPELCHNECPMNEMGEFETERSCYATNSEEPMLHGTDWYENDWCTKCHCENGERECVGSLCLPTTCSNPVKVPGQCCPQCPVGVENILIAHENSTAINNSSPSGKDLQDETTNTTTLSTTTENSTTPESTVSPSVATSTLSAIESSSVTSTVHVDLQNEHASTEENTELVHSSSISTEVTASSTDVTTSSTDITPSTTETTTTTRSIDDIASEVYYGPMIYTSTEQSNTSTQELLEQAGENITESTLEPQAETSTSTTSTSAESTPTVAPTSTTSSVSSNAETVSTETSTMEASSSTENSTEHSTELSTTASASIADDASTTVAAIYNESVSTTETSQPTPIVSSTTESTTTTSFKPTVSTATEMDSTSSTTAISSTTSSADTTTTSSTTTLLPVDTSSTQLYSPSTSSPHTSTVNPQTSTTFTTNSPYSSTAATQTVSTVVYWYTFSTSAPSPPLPQPTIYQPSVRKFFTRPEVRYIGAAVIAAFTLISALAVWKFCMPTRSDRLKNHYRTVPSSEATSLSHISSTSHSSMA